MCIRDRNKSDVTWNINLNTPARSLKGVLLLFEDPAPGGMGPAFGRNSDFYYNPCITKVQVTVEEIPNQLYAKGMLPYQHWDEIAKGFACKNSSTDMSTYFRNRYALWLDFRSSDDQTLHGQAAEWRMLQKELRYSSIRMLSRLVLPTAMFTF